jgi:hypothetical protein
MKREHLWDRELTTIEEADMTEVRELMTIVNSEPSFTAKAKETFRRTVVDCGAAVAMMNKFILTDEERTGLLNALRTLVGSLKMN